MQSQIEKPYIASKESNKVHIKFCPYGQNIKSSENGIFFNKISEAILLKFKPCKCLKGMTDTEEETAIAHVQEQSEGDSHLKEKFAVLQHFSEYVDPIKATYRFY